MIEENQMIKSINQIAEQQRILLKKLFNKDSTTFDVGLSEKVNERASSNLIARIVSKGSDKVF